jgi:hypothetical protein
MNDPFIPPFVGLVSMYYAKLATTAKPKTVTMVCPAISEMEVSDY